MPDDSSERPTPAASPRWLRRTDQGGVACLVVLGLMGTVVWWWSHGGPRGELIELEQAQPRQAKFLVDINGADWPELAQLPRIGETLARRIVESRRREGSFRNHEDLCRVKGIGPRTLQRLSPYLLPVAEEPVLADR